MNIYIYIYIYIDKEHKTPAAYALASTIMKIKDNECHSTIIMTNNGTQGILQMNDVAGCVPT